LKLRISPDATFGSATALLRHLYYDLQFERPIISTLVFFGNNAMLVELLRFVETRNVRLLRFLDLPQGRLRSEVPILTLAAEPVRMIRDG
jgi:hypothetical protein